MESEQKKTINFDESYLKQNSHSKSKKKERKQIQKSQINKVKPQSVKELLLQKLKNYKKEKQREKLKEKNDSFIPKSNNLISDSFLETIQRRKNKTEQNIHTDDLDYEKNDNHDTTSSKFTYSHNNISTSDALQTIVNNDTNQKNEILQNNILKQPYYSNLKNSSLPTYREWKNKSQKSLINPKSNRKSYKMNISKKLILGKNKTHKKVGIYIKNKCLKQKTDQHIADMKKEKIRTVKNYLKKNNLIRYGSTAPSELLREMFVSSKLCGEISNTNSKNVLDNFFEYNDENI